MTSGICELKEAVLIIDIIPPSPPISEFKAIIDRTLKLPGRFIYHIAVFWPMKSNEKSAETIMRRSMCVFECLAVIKG